jgi:hypothetical protein
VGGLRGGKTPPTELIHPGGVSHPRVLRGAGLPQDSRNLEIQSHFLMLSHYFAFATNTRHAPSQESFPEAGGGVSFNGISPMFFALR